MFGFSFRHKRAALGIAVSLVVLLFSGGLGLVSGASFTGGNHPPINIASDDGFTGCACVSGGTGMPSDPFIIGPWTIMATSSAPGVTIAGVTKSFTLLHITVHGTTTNDGIALMNVKGLSSTGQHLDSIQAANIDGARVGISLTNVVGVTITGNSVNNNFAWGIMLSKSHDNTVTFMTVAHNGLANPDSRELPDALDVFLGHELGGGVLFMNSHDNELSHSQLSEDAYAGFVLVSSDHNTITDVHSRYPDYYGSVLQDSSHNMIDGIDMQTADFVGLLVRGGGFNIIVNSDFSANGPIGNEIRLGIVPYYVSGIYLGWGTHDNVIMSDHSNNGNTGPGLVVDDGRVMNPVPSPVQNVNPFNNVRGNDLGVVPPGSAFDVGATTTAGSRNSFCGNSFASSYGTGTVDPNAACP